MLEVEVVPTVATTQKGSIPAARSSSRAASSAAGSMRKRGSVGIFRTPETPIPRVMAALSMDECTSSEAYIRSGGAPASPRSRTAGSAASRAAATAIRVEMEAVS